MKKLICILLLIALLPGCAASSESSEDWGSFTSEKSYSYDKKLYALQRSDEAWVIIDIYTAESDELLYSFAPARALDFLGVCWEKDTYNLWVQSGDVGTLRYSFDDFSCSLDENAMRPDYIRSKYDN